MSDPTRSRILTHPLSRRDLLKTAAAGGAGTLVLPLSGFAAPEASAQDTGTTLTGDFWQKAINPWQQSGMAIWTSLVFETLVTWDDNYSKILPALADSWSASADGGTYTFKLHPGVTWHDGQPFTAADVVWSYTTLLHPAVAKASGSWLVPNLMLIKGASAYNGGTAKDLPGITAPDDATVVITLEHPSPLLLDQIATPWILPKHLLEHVALDDGFFNDPYFSQKLVGLGPFQFKQLQQDQFITVAKYDGYYRGAPKLDAIVTKKVDQASVAILSQQKGELDAIFLMSPDDIATVEKDTNLDVFPGPGMIVESFGTGFKPALLKDQRVRQALLYALDRQTIVETLFKGQAVLVNTPYLADWVPLDGINQYAYDPKKAKALLAAAGWDSGTTLDVWAYFTDQFTTNLLAAFQQYFGDVGVKTAVKQTDFTNIAADYSAGNFGLLYQGATRGPDPDNTYIYFYSKNNPNNTLYSDPDVDRLYDLGRTTLDQTKRAQIYNQLAVKLNDLSFMLMLWAPNWNWSVTKSVTGTHGTMGTPGLHIPFYTMAETWTKRS
jgi:peptide/nickel transport system substrate-binding protein